MQTKVVGLVGLLAAYSMSSARADDEQARAKADLASLGDAEARVAPDVGRHLASTNPYEILTGLSLAADDRELVAPALLPRIVELVDDTAPRMTRECLQLLAEGDPFLHGSTAEGDVNTYGSRAEACRKHAWPSISQLAVRVLVASKEPNTVARLVVARVVAHPGSADGLAAAVHGSAALGEDVAVELAHTTDATKQRALLRLALQDYNLLPAKEIAAATAIAASGAPAVRARATTVLLLARDEATIERASAQLESMLDAQVIADLVHLGYYAKPLVPALTKRLQHGSDVGAVLAVMAAIGPQARAALPAMLVRLREHAEGAALAIAKVDGNSPATRRALLDAATTPMALADVVSALAAANVKLALDERQRLDRIFDRLCEVPWRKAEAQGPWPSSPLGCDDVKLDALP
ncbi:MAG TPA: hypothetical protein VMJ10_18675 [Kofleriaceae bacterium]|nr:hypothetical protein [Kofleriaceae bacterium]